MLTKIQIGILYQKYLDIIKLETIELGCAPTEVRHLIGRLGEFFCALETNGTLAKETNQHGFDVISENGRRVSVKTTAQTSGFVAINKKTLNKVDDLMILQYINNELQIIYFDKIENATNNCRTWNDNFELDISRAKKMTQNKE
ncbi:hypothetical protein E0I26_10925 [Flavobacterium rhamnosiphilum]|uniref:DUF6998 domain-containing protein n=1 Tax=Flavobacterium rhamnosiphilum TaxID=2541724 RepID=A0A4R5F7P6_9FLAO|nr:hypothetical protein [Flavobacterium rhamnosiphilum]TDE43557.1 hypothetical protein E0I26_10925 [Flavobacterium rhamnosiphilum]